MIWLGRVSITQTQDGQFKIHIPMYQFAAIYPDRITLHNSPQGRRMTHDQLIDFLYKDNQADKPCRWEKNLSKKKSSWKLSYQTKKKIRDSIQILYHMSKPRTVWNGRKKVMTHFRASMLTLTLPTKQKHDDKKIKEALNRFLVNMRKIYGLQNYVWKAELQKNKNIHFHIIVDKYIHYNAVRYYWNLSLSHLGYITDYKRSFQNLSLKEYAELRGITQSKAWKGFEKGQKSNWSNPPTENVRHLKTVKEAAVYVSKYLTKDSGDDDDIERIQNFGRVWARSQSLSSFQLLKHWDWKQLRERIKNMPNVGRCIKVVTYDWVSNIYINWKNITAELKDYINRRMMENALVSGYPIPT